MAIIRLYTGDDGQTHMEELDPASHPELTSMHGATGIQFRVTQAGYFSDWHNTPRRRYVKPSRVSWKSVLETKACTGLGRDTSPSQKT